VESNLIIDKTRKRLMLGIFLPSTKGVLVDLELLAILSLIQHSQVFFVFLKVKKSYFCRVLCFFFGSH
jgi:hypothetical protein